MEAALSWIREALPILRWAPSYERNDVRGDLAAGLTVGVMLIPQGMAYAVLAGMPPIYGLYAGLVPLLIYPLFGSCRHLATGPAAIDMLVIAAGVGMLATQSSSGYIELVVLATGIVALLQIGMATLRLGFLANLLSRPVIAGFATAASLIIMASQLGSFLGIDLARSQYLHHVLMEAAERIGEVHWISLAIGVGSAVAIVGLRSWKSIFPSELAVIVGATLAVWLFDLEARGVATVGDVPGGLPVFAIPSFGFDDLRRLLPTAITLALIQFMSVVSLGRIFASRHRYAVDANRELMAVGTANVVGSLFQSLPVSGSFSRTAVNEQAGARTPLSNVVAAAVVGLALVFLTPLFHDIPMAALAAVIMVAAVNLLDLPELRYLFRTKRVDGWISVFTFVSTLVLGVREGLLLGIGAAIIAVVYRQSRPYVAELGHLSSTRSFKNLERFAKAYPIEGLMILRIEAGFSFFNAQFLKEYILEKAAEGNVRAVVLDAGSINDMDTTAIEAVEEVAETLEEQGIEMHFAGLTGPVRDVMSRAGLGEALGPKRFHITPHRAVRYILNHWDEVEGTKRLELYQRSTELDEEQVEPTAESDLT